MKFAILADIHANLEALQAVLGDAGGQECTHYAFLGDFVGYCVDPKACLDIVRRMEASCILGNHDEYCATDLPLAGLNPDAARAVEWTRRQLNEDDRRWLHNLPYTLTTENFTLVHATLDSPERWEYAFNTSAAASSFVHQTTPLCFFGHTHVPVAFVKDTVVRGGTYTSFKIKPGKRYFVNPGAVGQPRDGNPRAAYAVYNSEDGTIELRRVEYDFAATRKKIREAGLGGG